MPMPSTDKFYTLMHLKTKFYLSEKWLYSARAYYKNSYLNHTTFNVFKDERSVISPDINVLTDFFDVKYSEQDLQDLRSGEVSFIPNSQYCNMFTSLRNISKVFNSMKSNFIHDFSYFDISIFNQTRNNFDINSLKELDVRQTFINNYEIVEYHFMKPLYLVNVKVINIADIVMSMKKKHFK